MSADTLVSSTAEDDPAQDPRPAASERDAAGSVLRVLPHVGDAVAFAAAGAVAGMSVVLALGYAVLGWLCVRPTRVQRARLDREPSEGLLGLIGRVTLAVVAVSVSSDGVTSGAELAILTVTSVVALLVSRHLVRRAVHASRRRGLGLERVLIVGGGPTGRAVARVLRQRREFGLRPIGFVEVGDVADELPTLGRPEELVPIMLANDARRVIVTFSGARERELLHMLRDCQSLTLEHQIHVLPRFYELGVRNGEVDDLWGFPLVPVRRSGPSALGRRAKRTLDVVGAALLLVIAAPAMLGIAVAVKASSPGPVLFRQRRVGQHGQIFEMLKFRTMRENGDSDTQWSVDDDERVTPIGRLLRPTHLDELPQLLNVLRGDMALVGPRPERPAFVDRFAVEHHGYEERHRVPVGLTGWAQVNGLWGDTSIEDRARFDNRYIEDWSLTREFRILARTVPTLLGRRESEEVPPEPEGVKA